MVNENNLDQRNRLSEIGIKRIVEVEVKDESAEIYRRREYSQGSFIWFMQVLNNPKYPLVDVHYKLGKPKHDRIYESN